MISFDRPAPAARLIAVAIIALGVAGCSLGGADTTQPQVTLSLADAAMASGAPEMALRVADLILTKRPGNAAALTARGDALYALGQAGLARSAYRAAVQTEPRNAEAQIGLGRTLLRSDPKAAEAAFLAASRLQPENTAALSDLGVARDMQQNHAGAQQAYQKALALAPNMPDVRMNLGLSLALSGQAAQAVEMLRPLAVNDDAAQLWRADLAVALAKNGDASAARRILMAGNTAAAPTTAEEDLATASEAEPIAAPAPRMAVEQEAIMPPIQAPMNVPDSTRVVTIVPPSDRAAAVIPASAHAAAVIPAAARVAAVIPAPRPVEQSRTTGWVAWAQIAAVRSQRDVAYEWRRLQARIAGLRGRALTVVPATAQGTTWWRLRVGSFATIDDAKAACALLRADGAGCLPIVSPPT